jgi:DNA repair protein RecO (recombination protein O)
MSGNIFNTKAIVLHQIKYAETSIIAWLFTEKFGRKSYIFNNARGLKSKYNFAIFQPLTQLDLVVYNNNKPHLQRVKEASQAIHYQSITSHFIKSTITFFLAEILCHTIREEEPLYQQLIGLRKQCLIIIMNI